MKANLIVCAILALSVYADEDTNGTAIVVELPAGTIAMGDMIFDNHQINAANKRNFGNGIRPWPQGVIPYRLDGSLTSRHQNYVRQAAEKIKQATGGCVKFVPYNGQANYVNMVNGKGQGCQAQIGFGGGRRFLSLENAGLCDCVGVAIHEMMHSAGMSHEHQRNDRDQYLNINWNNVNPNQRGNFEKMNGQTYGLPFDYQSIMLYGSYLFGRNNNIPTTTKKNGGKLTDLCQKNNLSNVDVQKIKKFYGCK